MLAYLASFWAPTAQISLGNEYYGYGHSGVLFHCRFNQKMIAHIQFFNKKKYFFYISVFPMSWPFLANFELAGV